MLHLGDCLDVMQGIPDGLVDLTVTSPPYDNLRTYNGNNDQWGEHVWQAVIADLYRVTADGGVVVWVIADATIKGSETGTSFKQALWAMECGFNLHDTMIWDKPNPIPRSHKRYEQSFEYMFVFSKSQPKAWNAKMAPCTYAGSARTGTLQHKSNGVRSPKHTQGVVSNTKCCRNVWNYAGKSQTAHPAEFPLQLATDHILSWSNLGDTVLDPFLGSGTTGVACVNTSRKFIGIERDADYFAAASARIRTAQADAITNKMREATRL